MNKRQTQTLNAIDESGKRVEIHVFQSVIDTSNMREGRSEALGRLKEAITSDGLDLIPVDEKTFQIVATGEKLRLI